MSFAIIVPTLDALPECPMHFLFETVMKGVPAERF
jgi:hypothetical protein